MSKHLFRIFVAALGLLCTALSSQATLALRLSADGGATWTTVMDNDTNDFDPTPGSILYDGSVGSWVLNFQTVTSMPDEGSAAAPYLELFGQNLSVLPGTIIIQTSETGFTTAEAARVFTNLIGGTVQGSITARAYLDSGNVLFGSTQVYSDANAAGVSPSPTAFEPAVLGPFTSPAFDGTTTWLSTEAGGPPFSATVEVVITHYVAGKVSSYDDILNAPAPPPVPSIGLTKQITCLQPTNSCLDFGKTAEGFKGLSDPGFCYLITLTNNGTLTITNITVKDSLLGTNINANFVGLTNGTLLPGQVATAYLGMSLDTTTTNTATVTGIAINADGSVNTNVTAVDNAVGIVDTAAITAQVTLVSACDEDNSPTNNHVLLPGCGEVCNVLYSVVICNTGAADLTNVTVVAPGLAPFGCSLPAPFVLLKGACTNFSCTLTMECTNTPQIIPVFVTGQAMADSNHCAIYDITSTNVISVSGGDTGTIECAACTCTSSIFGSIVLNCGGTNLPGSPAMTNISVTLFDSTNGVAGATLTDASGDYSFTNLPAGTYTVTVTPPSGYSETFPLGSTNNQIVVTLAHCGTTNNINFAYADENSPIVLGVPTGGDLGPNPPLSSIPTDASITALITAHDDRGPITNIVVTHVDSPSTNGCMDSRVFTIVVTGTCVPTTSIVTYTWTTDTTPPCITVPPSLSLGCNPTNIPTVGSIKLLVTATDNCGVQSTNITCMDVTNGCGITRTFTINAKDFAGNPSLTKTVVFTWTIDTNKPIITVIPGSTNYGCNPSNIVFRTDASIQAQVKVSDNCGTVSTNVVHTDSTNGCTGMRTFCITAIDGCGNVSAVSQVIDTWTVDKIAPTLKGQGSNMVINCPAVPVFTTPTVTDGCTGGTTLTNVDTYIAGSCPNSYAVTRTWTATDACGNSASVSQTISVVDVTAPTLTCASNVTIYTNITMTNCFVKSYCTFDTCDWCSPCNNFNNNYNNNWWGNWGYNCGANSWWATNCNNGGNNNGWNNNWSGNWGNYCSTWTNFWSKCATNQGNNNCGVNWNNLCSATTNCWGLWNQNNLSSCQWLPCAGNNPGSILTNCYKTVYTNGCVTIGLPTNGYCIKFTSCAAIQKYLTNCTTASHLTCNYTNPSSCVAGSFACKVLALQLNCDISDCDKSSGGVVGQCGDLYINDTNSPCNGKKVRDVLCIANTCLGGGDVSGYGCNVSNLCDCLDKLNCSFKGCQPSSYCTTHLCTTPPVTAPPPSVTGTATATDACDGKPTVTYTDSQVACNASNTYIFYRVWKAIDACGNSTTCTQTITLMPPPCTVSISGLVGRDCDANGAIDSGNPGISGITVTLSKSGSTVGTITTDSNGYYTFTNVLAGSYTVTVTTGTNYSQTYPSGNKGITVTVANCQCVSGVNFALNGITKCVSVSWSCPTTAKCGQTVNYTCTVVNTGTCCFDAGCQISCQSFGGWTQTCQTPVYPGQSCQFTKSYCYKTTDCGNFNCNASCTGYTSKGGSYNCGQGSCSTQVTRY